MTSGKGGKGRRRLIGLGIVAGYVAGTLVAMSQGYEFGPNTTVRCRKGHLFTTTWIPGASLKSVRLGLWRLQWCPVGRHVTLVHPVQQAELTEAERAFAHAHHDTRLP